MTGGTPEAGAVIERFTVPLGVAIRPSRRADLRDLEWFGLLTGFRAEFEQTYRRQAAGELVLLVAEANRFPAGQVLVDPTARRAEGVGVLSALRVLPCLQNLGIGSRLRAPAGRRPPAPGVLAIHQDGAARPYRYGKSEPAGLGGDPELAYGLELCRRGYVVVCPDRFPYESRRLAASPVAAAFADFRVYRGAGAALGLELTEDLYRGCAANPLLLEGWTALGKELYELGRSSGRRGRGTRPSLPPPA
jgi:hypothetical protein